MSEQYHEVIAWDDRDLRRFAGKSRRNVHGCLVWIAGLYAQGYGGFHLKGKMVRAHRFAWVTQVGPLLPGQVLCHLCDDRSCVDVAHLFVGTPGINSTDMSLKGKSGRGERQPASKLKHWQVLDVKRRRQEGEGAPSLADRYAVSVSTIYGILQGRRWRHVT